MTNTKTPMLFGALFLRYLPEWPKVGVWTICPDDITVIDVMREIKNDLPFTDTRYRTYKGMRLREPEWHAWVRRHVNEEVLNVDEVTMTEEFVQSWNPWRLAVMKHFPEETYLKVGPYGLLYLLSPPDKSPILV
jgi:hypothetical protein